MSNFFFHFCQIWAGLPAANEKFVRWLHKWETCRHLVFLVEHVLCEQGHLVRFLSRVFLFQGTAIELQVIPLLIPCGGGVNRSLMINETHRHEKLSTGMSFHLPVSPARRLQSPLSSAQLQLSYYTQEALQCDPFGSDLPPRKRSLLEVFLSLGLYH